MADIGAKGDVVPRPIQYYGRDHGGKAIAPAYGSAGVASLGHLDEYFAGVGKIVDRWRATFYSVLAKLDIAAPAFVRVMKAITPASKGKESMKDCVVIEDHLDAALELQTAGFSAPIVSASPNKQDHTALPSSAFKPDLALKFAALNIDHAPNSAAMKHLLGL